MNDLAFYNREEDEGTLVANPEYPDCDPGNCGGKRISHPEDPDCDPDNN